MDQAVIKGVLMNGIYIAMGLVCLYVGIKDLMQKDHPSKIGTAIYWIGLGIVLGLGHWIQEFGNKAYIFDLGNEKVAKLGDVIVGLLVVCLTIPAIVNKVKAGKNDAATAEHSMKMSNKIGFKIFIPAFTIGAMSLLFALFLPTIGAIPGMGIGVVLAAIFILIMSKDKPVELMNGGKRLAEVVGPLSLLPQLLASLGAVFTAAGVGTAVADIVGRVVPAGNIAVGIIFYAIGMALFTMIMGNAFAAFSVMTVGIGIPFVLSYGLNPNVIGMLALTSGYCGTLMTPMAANFNIVPVAVLEQKGKYNVIKHQIPIALCMLVIQIIMMNVMGR